MKNHMYYSHSGAVGVPGLLFVLFGGTLAAAILGTIYGYATYYIPFIYISFLLTIGFGLGTGFIVGFCGKLGKIRNNIVMLFMGIFFGLLGLYCCWVVWLLASSKHEVLIFNPRTIFAVMQEITKGGAWSIFSFTPTGFWLYSVWTIEALIIVGICIFTVLAVSAAVPFCERCNNWVETIYTSYPLSLIADPEEFVEHLENENYECLKRLSKADRLSTNFTEVEIQRCPECGESAFLTVKSVNLITDSDGKEQKNEDVLVNNLIIKSENCNNIKSAITSTSRAESFI